MDLKRKIVKWGNTSAITIPKAVRELLGADIGDTLIVPLEAIRVEKEK